MGLKTAGVGHFTIPTAPAAGTSCTSGSANVFTTTYVQLIASTGAAIFITGVHLEAAAAKAATYIIVQLATGAAGSETIVGQYLCPLSTGSTVALGYRQIYPPIPVANATRIACKTADSVGAAATLVTLECINQSNVVDDGVAVGSVAGAVGSVTGAVGSVTGAVGSVTAGVTLAASQHVIVDSGTVTTLTNLPAIPAAWLTATGIAASALNGKGDWNVGKTGYALTTADWAKAGDAMTLTVAYDAAKTALASSSYTAPDNASVTAIKAKTDSLTFTVAGQVDGNARSVNGVTVNGLGTSGNPWGP